MDLWLKVLLPRPDALSLFPVIHRMEGEGQFSEVFLSPLHACLGMSVHTYTHSTHMNEQDKICKGN